MQGRLYRSRTDYVIGGVCGGLAQYLRLDPVLVRIFFVLFTLAGGAGPVIYLLLWLIIPREDQPAASPVSGSSFQERAGQMRDEFIEFTHRPNQNVAVYIGVFLVALGFIYLLQAFNIPWLHWLSGDVLWPVLLIFGGGILLWRAVRGGKA